MKKKVRKHEDAIIPECIMPELRRLKILTKVRKAIKVGYHTDNGFSNERAKLYIEDANNAQSVDAFIISAFSWRSTEDGELYWASIYTRLFNKRC